MKMLVDKMPCDFRVCDYDCGLNISDCDLKRVGDSYECSYLQAFSDFIKTQTKDVGQKEITCTLYELIDGDKIIFSLCNSPECGVICNQNLIFEDGTMWNMDVLSKNLTCIKFAMRELEDFIELKEAYEKGIIPKDCQKINIIEDDF